MIVHLQGKLRDFLYKGFVEIRERLTIVDEHVAILAVGEVITAKVGATYDHRIVENVNFAVLKALNIKISKRHEKVPQEKMFDPNL